MFVVAHGLCLAVGMVGFIIFPILPKAWLALPLLLALLSMFNRKWVHIFLFISLLLATAANVALLKWQFDFGHTVPIIEVFQPVTSEPVY